MGSPARWLTSIIGVMSPTTVRPARGDLDLHLAVDDLLAHAQDVVERALAAARQADVRLIDAEVLHQMQDAKLVLDARVLDARVLQAVAQRLVEERESLRHEAPFAIHLVPVEDELTRAVGIGRAALGRTAASRSRAVTRWNQPGIPGV